MFDILFSTANLSVSSRVDDAERRIHDCKKEARTQKPERCSLEVGGVAPATLTGAQGPKGRCRPPLVSGRKELGCFPSRNINKKG